MRLRYAATALTVFGGLACAGCSSNIDTTYGRSRGLSINGTSIFAERLREQGDEVRTAVRLTEELQEWADVIVRFAPYPGPPDRAEAHWFARWLNGGENRRLIYVPWDYDARADYWGQVAGSLPPNTDSKLRERAEKLRKQALGWSDHLPKPAKEPGAADEWFRVTKATRPPHVAKTLTGPWAVGVDAAAAALTIHEALTVDAETVLLKADDEPLAMEWTVGTDGKVLTIANGSFLLNAALAVPARRPLAERVVAWTGDAPRHVAFVQGRDPSSGPAPQPTLWSILERIASFRWVAAQLLALGVAACLARAPRLGRPRPDPPSGADRPAAHPEALGALMARGRQADEARAILEEYRRWRKP